MGLINFSHLEPVLSTRPEILNSIYPKSKTFINQIYSFPNIKIILYNEKSCFTCEKDIAGLIKSP